MLWFYKRAFWRRRRVQTFAHVAAVPPGLQDPISHSPSRNTPVWWIGSKSKRLESVFGTTKMGKSGRGQGSRESGLETAISFALRGLLLHFPFILPSFRLLAKHTTDMSGVASLKTVPTQPSREHKARYLKTKFPSQLRLGNNGLPDVSQAQTKHTTTHDDPCRAVHPKMQKWIPRWKQQKFMTRVGFEPTPFRTAMSEFLKTAP